MVGRAAPAGEVTMDAGDSCFATTGAELDVQEALVALERVLGRPGFSGGVRVRLEEAAAALREIEAGAAAA